MRKQFPDEKAVMLNKTLEYNISVKDGKPYVLSNESQQIEYLSANASAFMSEFGFFQSDFQQAIAYEAYTKTPKDKKLMVSEFKTTTNKESFVFYDDVKETTFNFPAVEAGAIGNLHVSWINKDPHLLSPFYFSNYLPVINSELKIEVTKDIAIKYVILGLDTSQISVKIENKHRTNTYTFIYKNCPGDKKYDDAPAFSWFSPHVIFYIENYTDENGKKISYLSNTDDLYKLNYSFVQTINHSINPELKQIVDSLTAGQSSPEKKARSIYSWVQHQIKYVAFEEGMEGFVPRDANLVCSRRFGDCKDMSSILTIMLNYAGVPAYFTWIGTRDLPYKFTQLPLPLVSNHMICTIKLNDNFIFLDGTDPTCVFGFPSYAIQDKEAMISISEQEYRILTVPVIDKNDNVLTDTTWLELSGNTIKGKIKKELTGYFAMHMYGNLMYLDGKTSKEDMKDEFQRGSNKFQLDTFQISKKETNNSLTLGANFTLSDYVKKIGGDYFLNLNIFKFYEHEEIDYPRRKMPVEYNFKYVKKYVTLLKIPDDFKVSYLPSGKSYHNAVWGFNMKYEQKENWVILTQEFDNNNLMLTQDEFEQWNKVLEYLFPLYKETLSLSKN
ncbi:MAG TPA: transglutaminase domain-containing protein [Puia sp.]|nr:transglutaminase domain-containing protein [Puia sp.]